MMKFADGESNTVSVQLKNELACLFDSDRGGVDSTGVEAADKQGVAYTPV